MSPVRSMTPSRPPVSGSLIGAAAHVQRCTGSVKCSAAKTWTACSAASAVPTALVPAPASLHSAPSTKFISSAARLRSVTSPRMLSSIPEASLMTMRWSASTDATDMHSSISGAAIASGWRVPQRPRAGQLEHRRRALAAVRVDAGVARAQPRRRRSDGGSAACRCPRRRRAHRRRRSPPTRRAARARASPERSRRPPRPTRCARSEFDPRRPAMATLGPPVSSFVQQCQKTTGFLALVPSTLASPTIQVEAEPAFDHPCPRRQRACRPSQSPSPPAPPSRHRSPRPSRRPTSPATRPSSACRSSSPGRSPSRSRSSATCPPPPSARRSRSSWPATGIGLLISTVWAIALGQTLVACDLRPVRRLLAQLRDARPRARRTAGTGSRPADVAHTIAEFQITWAIVMAALTIATFRLPVAFTAVIALVVLALVFLIIGTLDPSETMTKAAGYVCFAFAALGIYLFLSAASVATGGARLPARQAAGEVSAAVGETVTGRRRPARPTSRWAARARCATPWRSTCWTPPTRSTRSARSCSTSTTTAG